MPVFPGSLRPTTASPLTRTLVSYLHTRIFLRQASSASSRWKQRQGRDAYARDARVQGLKSRAAFKLLELDAKHRLFRGGQTVIDLGYAPGSWSQVAQERTRPHGRVIGIDLIPAQPPRGVATFQGDFLSPAVQKMVKAFIAESHRIRPPPSRRPAAPAEDVVSHTETTSEEVTDAATEQPSYIDMERHSSQANDATTAELDDLTTVDVVLSDMLMNTSGNAFRDHAGSMDLCNAALQFASDTLRPGGHFVCKFYQGAEDKALELQLKKLFAKVHREKPDSSRSESKESYLVGLRRKKDVVLRL